MPRVANKRFRLQEPAGVFTDYAVGEIIKAAHEGHWYAIQNSEEYTPPPPVKKVEEPKVAEEPKAAEPKVEEPVVEETKVVEAKPKGKADK